MFSRCLSCFFLGFEVYIVQKGIAVSNLPSKVRCVRQIKKDIYGKVYYYYVYGSTTVVLVHVGLHVSICIFQLKNSE